MNAHREDPRRARERLRELAIARIWLPPALPCDEPGCVTLSEELRRIGQEAAARG